MDQFQINTLQQLINIASHRLFAESIWNGKLSLHALWFDVYTGNVLLFSRDQQKFVVIDETSIGDLLAELSTHSTI